MNIFNINEMSAAQLSNFLKNFGNGSMAQGIKNCVIIGGILTSVPLAIVGYISGKKVTERKIIKVLKQSKEEDNSQLIHIDETDNNITSGKEK